MRIIICTPYGISEPRGNSIAATRLRDGFIDHGHNVLLLERCEGADERTAREAARSFNPHVGLVMHGWRCAGSFHAIRSVSNAPLVVSLRGTDLNEMMKDPGRQPTIREVLAGCEGITIFSREAMERLTQEDKSLARKIRIVSNGIVLPRAGEAGDLSWVPPQRGLLFVGVAGIRRVKNLSWLVECLSALRQNGLDIHYVHAGPVLEEAEGERFLHICREEPWVHYAGKLPHEQIPGLLRLGHIFVSASRSEGMPHSAREAMLVGLPCLLSDIAGHRVLARAGREALLFRDRRDFTKKAAALAGNPGLRDRLKRGGRERVERACLNGKEIEAYLRFFSSLIRRKETAPSSLTDGY